MEDNLEVAPQSLTEEEIMHKEYDQKYRELKISNARSHVLKKQLTEAYEILESIRFDYLADSAFRDKITKAKQGIESALKDFLLSDAFWEKKIDEHRKKSPKN